MREILNAPQYLTLLTLIAALSIQSSPGICANPDDVPQIKRTTLGLYLTAAEAQSMVLAAPRSTLFIDVRSIGEIQFLGMPSMVDANVPYMVQSEWNEWDEKRHNFKLEVNSQFAAEVAKRLAEKHLTPSDPVILICRSGDRSAKAADLLAQLGYSRVFSVVDGFEGDIAKDGPHQGQRVVNGWKNSQLPWSYDLERNKMYRPEK